MASISDVENGLCGLIGAQLYPNGAPPSVLGYPVHIAPGWPDPATLDADMVETAPGVPTKAHVSTYPLPNERNVTRYQANRRENPLPTATYALTAAGQMVTVGGSAPTVYTPQNLALIVNGAPYVVQAAAGQTAAQVAAALGALVGAAIAGVSVTGAAITLPASARLQATVVGVTGSTTREVRRQERQFQIDVWSSNPGSRAAVADAFDPMLADTPFLIMPDGTQARLTYHGGRENDFTQKQRIYRRSLIYCVEYATTIIEPATQIVVAEALLTDIDLVDAAGNLIAGLNFQFPENSGLQPAL